MPVHSLTIICAALIIVWVYHNDPYDKEPWYAIILAAIVGFAAMWLVGLADDFAIQMLDLSHGRIIAKAATISLIEEGSKLLTVLLLSQVLLRRQFNDPMDGLVYGRIAGVGMALQESVLYLSMAPATLQTLGMEIVRLFAHSLMAGIVGFAVGVGIRAGGKRQYRPGLILLCLALSTTMHFGWDVVAYRRREDLLGHIMPMWIMLIMMLVWRWFWALAKEQSRQIFQGNAVAGA